MPEFTNADIIITIIVATLLFLLLASFCLAFLMMYRKKRIQHLTEKLMMENNFKQELLKTQLETQEDTFRQIGEDLHDNVGQLLSSTKMLLGITERMLPEIPDTLRTAEVMLGKAIQDLRSMSKSLNKDWLQQFNLIQNLQAELERMNVAGSPRIVLESGLQFLPLASEAQVMLLRILQEAVQNSLKHANPELIIISILFDRHILITVKDDGKGFLPEAAGEDGMGMMNMRHRTRLLGGTITWKSGTDAGTEVRIVIPVQNKDI